MNRIITIALVAGALAAAAAAEPMAPVSVSGSATFAQAGDNWTITTATDRTAINWTSFNVEQGATVHFQQPAATSAVLNRVLGGDISRINGLLSSNGAVYLVNPNGIVIGPGGVVRVSSFIATTLDVSDPQFLAGGDIRFTGESVAAVENLGTVDAIGGDVHLIARHVINKGLLRASEGTVNLIAATDVLLTQDHEIFVRPSGAVATGVGVDNSGVIEGVVARLAADGNMYALAVNNGGVIRATGSETSGGRVFLTGDGGSVVNSGQIVARAGSAGGEIEVTGSDVNIACGAALDASGDVGGSVVLFADDRLTVDGAIAATGSAGAGGFVETSGSEVVLAGMDLRIGSGGTWLLDPVAVNIDPILAAFIVNQLDGGATYALTADQITVSADVVRTHSLGAPIMLLTAGVGGIGINANIDITSGTLMLRSEGGVFQAPGTVVRAAQLQLKGIGSFMLFEPGNDFGVLGAAVTGCHNEIWVQDVNDLVIGNVGTAHGVAAFGGEVHLLTPNGSIAANGLFPAGMVMGYHALGNVSIAEYGQYSSQTYQINISNDAPSRSPAEVETFLGLPPGSLAPLSPETTIEGSCVGIEFVPLAGDLLGYSWNFRVRETFSGQSANDYSFVVVDPAGAGLPDKLADVEAARDAARQDSGLFSWQTGWWSEEEELNHTDPYALSFGVMDVTHSEFLSKLEVRDIFFFGHAFPSEFIFERIFDHVEDFPHVRPDPRTSNVGTEMLAPVLDAVTTYLDQSAQYVDPRYFYQSLGSIYQIPR